MLGHIAGVNGTGNHPNTLFLQFICLLGMEAYVHLT